MDSAWPVVPVLTVPYAAVALSPPEEPAITCRTPFTCSNTPWVPQKQPPASTAVCSELDAVGMPEIEAATEAGGSEARTEAAMEMISAGSAQASRPSATDPASTKSFNLFMEISIPSIRLADQARAEK